MNNKFVNQDKINKVLRMSKNKDIDTSPDNINELIHSKCSTCGRGLNALERFTFFDQCIYCADIEVAKKRDLFFKKNLVIGLALVFLFMLIGYINYFCKEDINLLLGVHTTIAGVVLFYIFATSKKLFSNVFGYLKYSLISVAVAIFSTLIGLIIKASGKGFIMYIFLVMVLAYFGYIAYKDLEKIKSKYYIINTYKRKLSDEKYMEELEKDFIKKDKTNNQSEKILDNTNEKVEEQKNTYNNITDNSLGEEFQTDTNMNNKQKEKIKSDILNNEKIKDKNDNNTSADEGGSWII